MARGDQIYVMRPLAGMEGVYEHHGIDCGDGTVIHYQKRGEATITRTTLADFAQGKPVFVKKQSVAFIPDVVIARAESRIGERQYNLMHNNCEHFANWCKTGSNESEQLTNYGFSGAWVNTLDSQRLIRNVAQESDPVEAVRMFGQAEQNIAIAQYRLQSQYNQAQAEMETWHRAAQLALSQGKEYLARAALERKVTCKRQAADLKTQLDQLASMQDSLSRNNQVLQERYQLQTSSSLQ